MINTNIISQIHDIHSIPLIINADVYAGINHLQNDSIDCVITSPPYYGQRDYGFDGQIGNESSAEEYIYKLGSIFSLLKEKLKSKGVFFLNIGDKYIQRYGFSNLGLIPYKLAKHLEDNGWFVIDILIWYKPNHMPSSYQNRFTGTYEPIFVLSKNRLNYFSIYKESTNNFTNILKINLQPTKFKHVAVFPEKLIESLLNMGLPENSIVLDPFAGSGTTLKAIQNLNNNYHIFNNKDYSFKGIMIEANKQYIEIIIDRCKISDKENITSLPFKPYSFNLLKSKEENVNFPTSSEKLKKIKRMILLLQKDEFENNFNNLLNGKFYNSLSDDGVVFLGIQNFSLENITKISTLVNYGWVIRNQLVINKNGNWYPVFVIVKDVKKNRYKLNIDAVRVKHKTADIKKWDEIDFIGYRVINNFSINKGEGIIIKIIDFYADQMPKNITVSWNNNTITNEIIRHNGEPNDNLFNFLCPNCGHILDINYNPYGNTHCKKCNCVLWKDKESVPKLHFIYKPDVNISIDNFQTITERNTRKNYNGKFLNEKSINFGASPGARSSLQEKYFATQRFFDFQREIIPDLLKIYLRENNISQSKLVSLFPPEYKHTIGHWFRKDIGGSLPLPEDFIKLQKLLNFPASFLTLVNSRCIVFQDVKVSHKGKNPGDYLELSDKELLSFLNKL